MNRRLITYNYLKTIANGTIYFHAFSYQYPGSGCHGYTLQNRLQSVFFAPKSSSALLIIRKTQLLGP